VVEFTAGAPGPASLDSVVDVVVDEDVVDDGSLVDVVVSSTAPPSALTCCSESPDANDHASTTTPRHPAPRTSQRATPGPKELPYLAPPHLTMFAWDTALATSISPKKACAGGRFVPVHTDFSVVSSRTG
jgi:hypothetical protein